MVTYFEVNRYISLRFAAPISGFSRFVYHEVHEAMTYLSLGYPEKAKNSFKLAVSRVNDKE